jgi:hypothetical protein
MAPWLYQPCPHPDCVRHITDLLAEMVPDPERATPDFKAIMRREPGGAITCPFCERAVEFNIGGTALTVSSRTPLRYSPTKTELRAVDYGMQLDPPHPDMTPVERIAQDKLMSGALHGYVYAEDASP